MTGLSNPLTSVAGSCRKCRWMLFTTWVAWCSSPLSNSSFFWISRSIFPSMWIPLWRFKTSTGLPAVSKPYAEWIFLEIWKLLILCWTQLSVSRACGSQSWLNLWFSHPMHLWQISSFLPTPNSSILQSSKSEPRGLKLPLDVVDLNKAGNCVDSIKPLKLPNWTKTRKLWLADIRLKRETYICIMCTQKRSWKKQKWEFHVFLTFYSLSVQTPCSNKWSTVRSV